jgi:hypothetical protein
MRRHQRELWDHRLRRNSAAAQMVVSVLHPLQTYYTNKDIESAASAPIATINPPKSAEATGLVQGALDGQDEDGNNDDSEAEDGAATNLKSNRETSDGMYIEHLTVYIAYQRRENQKEKGKEEEQEESPCSADQPSSCRTCRCVQEQAISRRPACGLFKQR